MIQDQRFQEREGAGSKSTLCGWDVGSSTIGKGFRPSMSLELYILLAICEIAMAQTESHIRAVAILWKGFRWLNPALE